MHLDNCTEKEIQSRPVATDNGTLLKKERETIPKHRPERKRRRDPKQNRRKMKEKVVSWSQEKSDEKIKRIRAQGGCPGANRRRRTRQAAKSHGELQASIDPWISEWGNPSGVMPGHRMMNP